MWESSRRGYRDKSIFAQVDKDIRLWRFGVQRVAMHSHGDAPTTARTMAAETALVKPILSSRLGAAVVAHSCTHATEQQWALEPLSNSSEATGTAVYRLRASGATSGVWCLDNHYSP